MAKKNLDEFIDRIDRELPDLISPDDLLELNIAGSHAQLFRLRQKDTIPFLKLSSGRILYLKSDIIEWLKRSYNITRKDGTRNGSSRGAR